MPLVPSPAPEDVMTWMPVDAVAPETPTIMQRYQPFGSACIDAVPATVDATEPAPVRLKKASAANVVVFVPLKRIFVSLPFGRRNMESV